MAENKSKKLPQFDSSQELVEFFDTHDMGEYEDELLEAHFDVDISRLRFISITVITLVGLLMQSNILLAHDNHQHNSPKPVKTDSKKVSEHPRDKYEQTENKSKILPTPRSNNSSELTQKNFFLQPGEVIFGLLLLSPFGLLTLKRWIYR